MERAYTNRMQAPHRVVGRLPAPGTDLIDRLANKRSLVVTGSTVPLSEVSAGGPAVKADAQGAFALTLQWAEGLNKFTFQSKTPDGQTLTWVGSVTLDLTPPKYSLSLPRVTNVPEFEVRGSVEEGASVTVNGEPAKVVGPFFVSKFVDPKVTPDIMVVIRDAAGNEVVINERMEYTSAVSDRPIDSLLIGCC